MDLFKKYISFLLVFSLMAPSFSAFGRVDPREEIPEGYEEGNPQNPPGTPAGVTCTQMGDLLPTGGVCCLGLTVDSAGRCDDDPVYADPALTSCTSIAQCGPGTGCYPQRGTDLYSFLSPNTESQEVKDAKRAEVETQLSEIDTPKPVGAPCSHAKECESYSCSGVCLNKMICRFADKGESLTPGAKCGGDYVEKNGRCELSPESQNPIFLGLIDQPKVTEIDPKQCQYALDENTIKRSRLAMRSLRAMEWLFSTINLAEEEECYKIMPVLKNEIGVELVTQRKAILQSFSTVLKGIEDDFQTLMDAKEQGERTLPMHGEAVSEAEIASRQGSGWDTLMLMYRKNILLSDYEKTMSETLKPLYDKLEALSKGMGDDENQTAHPPWKDDDKFWKIKTTRVDHYACEGSHYHRRRWFKWRKRYNEKVKNRWSTYYQVTGNAPANSEIIKRPEVLSVLALLQGGKVPDLQSAADKTSVLAEYTKPVYFLLDPMVFAGIKHGDYGERKPLPGQSGFLWYFGAKKDHRDAYYIKGDDKGSFRKIHRDLGPKLEAFYKSLKLKPEQEKFIYEPELVTTDAKDCLDPKRTEKCSEFSKHLEGVKDEAFAHFLAYSYANTNIGYFEDAKTYRRRLLRKLRVDMQNLQTYYREVYALRNKQNECIEKLANGLLDKGILAEDDGKGLQEGGTYFDGSKEGKGRKAMAGRKRTVPRLSPKTRERFSFDLRNTSLSDINTRSLVDSVANGSGGEAAGGGVPVDADGGLLAARANAMKKANLKASAAGVNIGDKEKAVNDTIASMMKKSGSAGSGAGAGAGLQSGGGSHSSNFGGGSGAASLGAQDEVPVTAAVGEGVQGSEQAAGAAAGEAGGLTLGSYDASGSAGHTDGTGLSEADKNRMMSEYEHNKDEYKGSEDDGIFEKVSKAYVRNLDKVLIRKKKLDEN